jgi:hypothetical protein
MVIEIATFRLAANVDEASFLEADQRVQIEFMHQQPGFTRRTTARGAEGDWLVVVLWGTERDALAAAAAAEAHPAVAAFNSMVDNASFELKRFESLD